MDTVFTLSVSGCVQLLQDTLGSAVILGSGTMELSGSGFRPSRQDVFEFVNHCGNISSTHPDEVSHLKAHTKLSQKHLGQAFVGSRAV